MLLVFPSMRPVTSPLVFPYSCFFIHGKDTRRFQVFPLMAKEMNFLPQLYQRHLASSETVTLALPSENYHRSFSHGLLMFVSDYYQALQRNITPYQDCYFCSGVHNQRQFCLPLFSESPRTIFRLVRISAHPTHLS